MNYDEMCAQLKRESDCEVELTLDEYRIPGYMREPLLAYVVSGRRDTGDFLRAVLSNDLKGAVGRADSANETLLVGYVRWLYNWAPGGCWGSAERVEAWQRAGGLLGVPA